LVKVRQPAIIVTGLDHRFVNGQQCQMRNWGYAVALSSDAAMLAARISENCKASFFGRASK
jgi:hypothetical protein